MSASHDAVGREGFTAEKIARCRAAMSKPGPIFALRTLASGRAIVEVAHDKVDDVLIDRFDGRAVRDPDHPDCKMGLAGSWPLYAAGMIDRYGVITSAGRCALATATAEGPAPDPARPGPAGGDT